ncbi:MAG: aminotransferase class IV [Thermodesulfobacteriota bacterium]|nr:aminotransferase class IV [Thermodesulfobacteriota bacterium]
MIYINEKLFKNGDAKISVLDHGFLYGDALFETMKSYGKKIFRLDSHLKRLFNSLHIIKIKPPLNKEELKEAIYVTLKASRISDAYIRVTISRGKGDTGIDPSSCRKPNVIIITKKYHPVFHKSYKAIILDQRKNSHSILHRIKSANFLENILAKIAVREKGVDEGFFFNEEQFLAEGIISNIFVLNKDKILTPDLGCGILPGITREAVIELALNMRLNVEETKIKKDALFKAEEIFITNSLLEVMPVVRVNDISIGDEKAGRITREIQKAYKELVKKETGNRNIA